MSRYCDPPDIERQGINGRAIEELSAEEKLIPTIEDASGVIDSYLRQRYVLPLLLWGRDIRGCCAVIAAWYCLRVRGIAPDQNPSDLAIYKEYLLRIAWLERIMAGTIAPDVTDSSGGPPGSQQRAAIMVSNAQRGFELDSGDTDTGGAFQGKRRS